MPSYPHSLNRLTRHVERVLRVASLERSVSADDARPVRHRLAPGVDDITALSFVALRDYGVRLERIGASEGEDLDATAKRQLADGLMRHHHMTLSTVLEVMGLDKAAPAPIVVVADDLPPEKGDDEEPDAAPVIAAPAPEPKRRPSPARARVEAGLSRIRAGVSDPRTVAAELGVLYREFGMYVTRDGELSPAGKRWFEELA